LDQSRKPQARRNNGLDRFLKRYAAVILKVFYGPIPSSGLRALSKTGENLRKTLTAYSAADFG
jgi:hypothetical protein